MIYRDGRVVGATVYVDRGDPAAVDWALGALTTDAAWHDLDLSSIIPLAAAECPVHFSIMVKDNDGADSWVQIRTNGNANAISALSARTQVAAAVNFVADGFVVCDASRLVEYCAANVTWNTIDITVRGWFERADL